MLSKFDLRKYIKVERVKREREKQTVQFAYGDQDQVDLISYSGLEEQSTYVVIEDTFVRSFAVTGYPYVASTGWLSMLVNFNHNIDISYHIEQVDPLISFPKLNKKKTQP